MSSQLNSRSRDHGRVQPGQSVLVIAGNRPLRALRRLLAPQGTPVFVGGEGGGRVTGGLARQLRPAVLSRFTSQRFATFWVARPASSDLDLLRDLIQGSRHPRRAADVPTDRRRRGDGFPRAGAVSGKSVLVP